ncbi:LytTR family DNA-binding domain-containing protein [Arabiibacter massiliensis]|uniref:LytTR family DNA-binding domain-containing protein n=1 Tax=Arabiibacter massiliensis TaxID=1870985 RepID=UPI0009B98FF7|nr:LytTR family DNA-binding domain-containing protein [Arabiibacter massiliensis]
MAKEATEGRGAPVPEWKEQVLIDLSRQTAVAFDVTNDEEAAFRWVADDVEWFGPFSWQAMAGVDSIREAFVSDKGEGTLSLSDEHWHARRVGSAWVVIGSCMLAIDVPELKETLRFKQRMTFVWGRRPEGPRIACVHCSHAIDGGVGGPPASTANSDMLRLLREHFGEEKDDGKLAFRDVAGHIHYLAPDEVLCVIAEGPHCRVRSIWGGDEEFLVREGIQKMEGRLPDAFVRAHRSCVVNVGHVARIEQQSLLLDDGSTCPLAVRRRQAVRARAAHMMSS